MQRKEMGGGGEAKILREMEPTYKVAARKVNFVG